MLTSRKNPLVKSFRKLHQAKFRKQSRTCLLEGSNLIEAASHHQYPLEVVCWTPDWQSRHEALGAQIETQAERIEVVSDEVLAAIATTQSPDGVAAIVPWPTTTDLPQTIEGVGLVLETIQDPGNLGAILRSGSAACSTGLFLSSDCVALTNPKVMRASAGAWFQVPTYHPADLRQTLAGYQAQGVKIIATLSDASQPYWNLDYRQPSLILIGNEGKGLSKELIELADIQINIPVAAGTESLNAAIAASIILFEGQRQRFCS
ncbi:MAG: RNA methyltransferase [Cyanobacteria bacterium P01_F01_bin.42]